MFDQKANDRMPASTADARAMAVIVNDAEPSESTSQPLPRLVELVEQVNRIIYGLGFAAGLNPAQWAALRYFMRAPAERRTVGALAIHQGVTAPTASETVSALVRKGLITRQPLVNDRRSHLLALTPQGEALLLVDPLAEVGTALRAMTQEQQTSFGSALDSLASQLLARRREMRARA